MERRGQERDIGGGMPNSMGGHNPPQLIKETPVKLPLAPIVSTTADRRGNGRRGTSIFSPTTTQTLEEQHHHQLNHPPLPAPRLAVLVQREPSTDPDPDPTHSTTSPAAAAANSNNPESAHQQQQQATTDSVRYRECLKNHAATMGGHVLDGCGEFMPSGEDGTPQALRCAACDCHRNFHRREVDGEPPPQPHYYTHNPNTVNNHQHRNTPLLHGQAPPPLSHQHKQTHSNLSQGFAGRPAMVNFGAGGESSSEDFNMFQSSGGGGHAVGMSGSSKKRFRTKFSKEQKERMEEYAEKIGWRIQKQDEQEVQQFCNEVGVRRQAFKVWMHNNKQQSNKRRPFSHQ